MTTESLSFLIFSIIFLLTCNINIAATNDHEGRKVYIVYMGSLPDGEYSPSAHHINILKQVTGESYSSDHLVRSYGRSFNGFAARLTSKEAKEISGWNEVVSVFPSRNLKLQTTRSWDFVGLVEDVKRAASAESDIIIGVIDSGVWPESESFSDKGFGPPPKKWKGACIGGKNFTCNKKLIGARHYNESDTNGTRDLDGHGTHTASTAAGSIVKGANFYGLAKGNARGGVPSARIAAYKACYPDCLNDAILAAFDDAIADGVDILSVSIGGNGATFFEDDAIAIGSFHATRQGVLTVQAAGNNGDFPSSVESVLPWLLTVAASTTDRWIIDKFTLGDKKTFIGSSINTFELNNTFFPLAYGNDIQKLTKWCYEEDAKSCNVDCIDETKVKGKIVLCNSKLGLPRLKEAQPLGAIVIDDSLGNNVPDINSLPGTFVDTHLGNGLISYINSTKMARVRISKSEEIKDSTAPVVAKFSGRGPNPLFKDILKPDITAPGVAILAAYSPLGKVSFGKGNDTRSVNFSIVSGTSMSCPHVSGAAAYVKSFHPNWSPSAIKSALMTTAWRLNANKHKDKEFAYGAGHINPVRAVDPGLVYETFEADYIKFLCSAGYNVNQIRKISGDKYASCKQIISKSGGKELNYPTITAQVKEKVAFNISFPRTVTNVGHANSTYRANVSNDSTINVSVVPDVLSFKFIGEKKSFVVNVVGRGLPSNATASGSLVWSDGIHIVRSPITLYTPFTIYGIVSKLS